MHQPNMGDQDPDAVECLWSSRSVSVDHSRHPANLPGRGYPRLLSRSSTLAVRGVSRCIAIHGLRTTQTISGPPCGQGTGGFDRSGLSVAQRNIQSFRWNCNISVPGRQVETADVRSGPDVQRCSGRRCPDVETRRSWWVLQGFRAQPGASIAEYMGHIPDV